MDVFHRQGVTSIVRSLGLEPACFDRLLDFFHSSALDLDKLTRAWCALVFRLDPGILRVNGRPVLAGGGIKIAKAAVRCPLSYQLNAIGITDAEERKEY
ncbi:MAG TPA: hypothetical protein VGZ73_20460 [Bryobacteraceae bacterium]|nr:hypothetical protein [Bryobacteraceae bacterium]